MTRRSLRKKRVTPKVSSYELVNQLKQRHGTLGNPAAMAGVVPIDRRVIPHEIVMTEVQRRPLHRRLPTCLNIDFLTSTHSRWGETR